MPPLLRLDGFIGVSAKEKTGILFDRFFTPVSADLSDIQEAFPPIFTLSLDTSLSSIIVPSSITPLVSPISPISLISSTPPISSTPLISPTLITSLSPSTPSFYPILPYDYNISYKEVR